MTILELTDEYFMRQALIEAEKAFEANEVPIGAVIVCENKIIARAHNLTERLKDCTAHAEMQAFTSASDYIGGKYLNECSLYVTLEPCFMCAGAIIHARVKTVVFAAYDQRAGAVGSLANILQTPMLNHTCEVTAGVREEESVVLLQSYFQQRRTGGLL